MPTPARSYRHAAFTVTELILVIAIFAVLLGIGLPVINAIQAYGSEANGVGQVTNAVVAARAYATRPVVFAEHGAYSGAAALFTPSGQIRLVENVPDLEEEDGDLLEPERSGYTDIPVAEPGQLPHNIRVVGIARNSNGTIFLAPPIAVRFNEHGMLIAAQTSSPRRNVFYDGNRDGNVDDGNVRTAGAFDDYNPGVYDPDSPDFDPDVARNADGNLIFPIEVIEAVIGLYVFDRDALLDAGHNLVASGETSNPINQDAADWIEANAIETLLFDRYTGQPIKRGVR
jgi:hypothetical protein